MNSLQVTIRVFEDDFINVLNTNYKNDLDLDSDLNQKKSWKFLGIMSYGAKFASSLYGPFRDALDSKPGLRSSFPSAWFKSSKCLWLLNGYLKTACCIRQMVM